MSFNLLDLVKDQVTGQLAKQASSFLGESEANTAKGLDSIFPALLGSAIGKVENDSNGASSIMNLIKGLDTNALGNIGSLFGGGASGVNSLLNSGGGIVNLLLGNKIGGLVDIVTKAAGIKSGSASSLIKMAAPFLLNMIGKKIGGGGVSGLLDLLKGQKSNVSASMPAGFADQLGLGNILGNLGNVGKGAVAAGAAAVTGAAAAGNNVVNSAKHTAKEAVKDVKSVKVETPKVNRPEAPKGGGMGWLKWLLPLLAILGLLWFFTQGGCNKTADAVKAGADKTVNVVKDGADVVGDGVKAVGDGIGNIFGEVNEAAKAALGKITFAAGSAGDQIVRFIDGGFKGESVFRFKNLNFATGKAMISEAGQTEVDNLAAVLKAYPSVKAEIAGYTDNTGNADANMTLSESRANSVKNRLVAAGISADRLTAKGYGSADPVASNDTAEGRAENRRTVVRIVK